MIGGTNNVLQFQTNDFSLGNWVSKSASNLIEYIPLCTAQSMQSAMFPVRHNIYLQNMSCVWLCLTEKLAFILEKLLQ